VSRMEMIYIDTDRQARKTGVGAVFDTPSMTWQAFCSTRPHAVPIEEADFILDYYNRKGDLSASIPISRASFERITGERALTDAEYRALDAQFWRDMRDEVSANRRAGALAFDGNDVRH
jgi:hypothetical protein